MRKRDYRDDKNGKGKKERIYEIKGRTKCLACNTPRNWYQDRPEFIRIMAESLVAKLKIEKDTQTRDADKAEELDIPTTEK